jgi:intein/homing endonuclease
MSLILRRLFKKGKLIRTKVQLSNGFIYSLENKDKLEQLYYRYLLPYDFANKELISLIENNNFEKLRNDISLNIDNLLGSKFLSKYEKNCLIEREIELFLAELVAFIMGDGHINNKKRKVFFFFRYLEDAEYFVSEFKSIFFNEHIKINKTIYCYQALITSSSLGNLLHDLGAPKGRKVLQSFSIPDWIYYGSDDVKKAFLSVIYGNEGSKPQDNKWRIQFVMSKNKENIEGLLIFLNQIRTMLNYFGISSSNIQVRSQKGRKFYGRFYIKGKENLHKFYNLLEFSYASEKQRFLEHLIIHGQSPKCKVRG